MPYPLTAEQTEILRKLYYDDKFLFGRDRIYEKVRDKGISRRQVMEWLKLQEIHQLFSQTRKTKEIKPTILSKPNSQLAIDLKDIQTKAINGYNYILTAIDLFSKKAYAEALKNKEGQTVLEGFKKILKKIGSSISAVRSDRGSEFIGDDFKKFLDSRNIKQDLSIPNKPQSNGGIERFNGTLGKLIDILIRRGERNWKKYLQNLVDNYNSSAHSITKEIPNDLQKGDKELNKVAKENIKKSVLSRNEKNDIKFEVGDKVRLKIIKDTLKSANRQTFTDKVYEIRSVVIPKSELEAPYYYVKGEKEKLYNNDLLLITEVQNGLDKEEFYEISKIIKPVINNNDLFYEVKWKGYDGSTIEPRAELIKDVPKLIKKFEKNYDVKWLKTKGRFVVRWSGGM